LPRCQSIVARCTASGALCSVCCELTLPCLPHVPGTPVSALRHGGAPRAGLIVHATRSPARSPARNRRSPGPSSPSLLCRTPKGRRRGGSRRRRATRSAAHELQNALEPPRALCGHGTVTAGYPKVRSVGRAPVQDATGAGGPADHLEDIEHGDLRRERPESRPNQPRPRCATDRDARDRVTGAEVASLCRGRLRSDTPVTDDVRRNTLERNLEDTGNARQPSN
jgi:hypothetical protein